LIWLDVQVLRLVTFGRSLPGETISAAAWSLESDGKWQGKLLRPAIDALFYFMQRDHCAKAWDWQRHLYEKE
jgi:hypothetical protein